MVKPFLIMLLCSTIVRGTSLSVSYLSRETVLVAIDGQLRSSEGPIAQHQKAIICGQNLICAGVGMLGADIKNTTELPSGEKRVVECKFEIKDVFPDDAKGVKAEDVAITIQKRLRPFIEKLDFFYHDAGYDFGEAGALEKLVTILVIGYSEGKQDPQFIQIATHLDITNRHVVLEEPIAFPFIVGDVYFRGTVPNATAAWRREEPQFSMARNFGIGVFRLLSDSEKELPLSVRNQLTSMIACIITEAKLNPNNVGSPIRYFVVRKGIPPKMGTIATGF